MQKTAGCCYLRDLAPLMYATDENLGDVTLNISFLKCAITLEQKAL